MLLKRDTLQGIASGKITVVFRRWKKPTVRAGGRLRTPIGELAIEALDVVAQKSITDAESRRAGFASRADVLAELRGREGKTYRVRVRLAGPDQRLALRTKSKLTAAEKKDLVERLERMDARSTDGVWTRAVLNQIAARPEVRAGDLADEIGMKQLDFKRRVRRLKELGLTESLGTGYRLSPRGRALFAFLPKN